MNDAETTHYWNYLKEHFTEDYFRESTFNKDEYVVGKDNDYSFCNIVEYKLSRLGRIGGSYSMKFGLYYGHNGENTEADYRFAIKFGSTPDEAFTSIKAEIANIIHRVQRMTAFYEIQSKLSPMFKYKLMFLYSEDLMLPIYLLSHIQHFERCLGLRESLDFAKGQLNLLRYRSQFFPGLSGIEFMRYLYRVFGIPTKKYSAN